MVASICISCVKPRMAFSGVRNSWLMVARKRPLAKLAASARALASCSSAVRSATRSSRWSRWRVSSASAWRRSEMSLTMPSMRRWPRPPSAPSALHPVRVQLHPQRPAPGAAQLQLGLLDLPLLIQDGRHAQHLAPADAGQLAQAPAHGALHTRPQAQHLREGAVHAQHAALGVGLEDALGRVLEQAAVAGLAGTQPVGAELHLVGPRCAASGSWR